MPCTVCSRLCERTIDRLTQQMQVAAQTVARWRLIAPEGKLHFFPAHHARTLAHQEFEQFEAGRIQLQRLTGATDLPGGEIEHQIIHLQTRLKTFAAPQHGIDARRQFGQGKGLDQIVIGAFAQPVQTIIKRIAGGQHDDRRALAAGAQAAAELKAIHARQHDVEHDQVIAAGQRQVQAAGAVVGAIDDMPSRRQVVRDVGQNVGMVFDDEQAHGSLKAGRDQGGVRPRPASRNRARDRFYARGQCHCGRRWR